MLYALEVDDRIVATDLTSNYPPAARDTVKLDSFSFNVEEVTALDPDLVIVAFDFQGETAALAALDIPFLLLGPPPTIEHAFSQLLNVGVAVGRPTEAGTLTETLVAELGRIIGSSAPLRGVTIFHEVDETLYSASSESFIGDLYTRLGLVNIADRAEVGGPFPQLSAEFIVDQDPEFIFLADANFGVTPQAVAARPGWDTIRAVAAGNIVELDGDIAGRWGPRTVDLLQAIFEAVEAKVP
jgi:iron complex transport system substrate-binding protein